MTRKQHNSSHALTRANRKLLAKLQAIALLDSAADIAAKRREVNPSHVVVREKWSIEDILRREG